MSDSDNSQSNTEQSDDYFEKLAQFTQEQQQKVAKVIDDSAKVMEEFKPYTVVKDINTQVESLIKTVDEQLEKAMQNVQEQMKKINTNPHK